MVVLSQLQLPYPGKGQILNHFLANTFLPQRQEVLFPLIHPHINIIERLLLQLLLIKLIQARLKVTGHIKTTCLPGHF